MPLHKKPPTRSTYLRLDKTPDLIFQDPICEACNIEVESHDEFICPSCGTIWDFNDPSHGQLAIEWEDDEYIEDAITPFDEAYKRGGEAVTQYEWVSKHDGIDTIDDPK